MPPEETCSFSAQTGSGKTLAYGLAIAPNLRGNAGRLEPAGAPFGLVVAPTRELALQVQRELEWLYAYAGARVVSCVGGMDIRREQRTLARDAHIVVGTPGRLRDHLERGHLDASRLRAAVLDEADEMLDLGFREDLEFILEATPADRRSLLFSATIPRGIAALAKRYQRDALRIAASVEDEPHVDIEYRAIRIAPNESEHAVVNVLRYFEARGALVFCSTRAAVKHLYGNLLERGFAAVALSGKLPRASAYTPCRRSAPGGRVSASPPMWRRAVSTCRTSGSSSMPTCRTTARCCCTGAAAPAGRVATAPPCCSCRTPGGGVPSGCWSPRGSGPPGRPRHRRMRSGHVIGSGW
jgi:hypothetical protein